MASHSTQGGKETRTLYTTHHNTTFSPNPRSTRPLTRREHVRLLVPLPLEGDARAVLPSGLDDNCLVYLSLAVRRLPRFQAKNIKIAHTTEWGRGGAGVRTGRSTKKLLCAFML